MDQEEFEDQSAAQADHGGQRPGRPFWMAWAFFVEN